MILSRPNPKNAPALIATGIVLFLLYLPPLSRAEVPRHSSTNGNHAYIDSGKNQNKPDGIHKGHPEQTPTDHEHTQSSADQHPSESVGLDERLGSTIPLELTFRDETGSAVRLVNLIDKPTIIAPVYYRCPNVCHFLQGDLARVLPQLKLKAGDEYQVLSISFDEKETSELAQRSRNTYYAAMNDNYPSGAWKFLTGDLENITTLTDSAGFHFQRVGTEFLHPVAFFIVSKDGKIIRYLHGTHIVPKDLVLALYEAREGRVGATIRKVVQFCFSFDPEQKTYVFNLLRVSATVILGTLAVFLAFLVLGGRQQKKRTRP